MKKSQVTLFIIIGLLVVMVISIILSRDNTKTLQDESRDIQVFSSDKEILQKNLEHCTENSAIKSNVKYGIHETTKQDYISYFKINLADCMTSLVITFKEHSTKVILGEIDAELEINNDNLVFIINYPIKISNNKLKYTLDKYTYVFDKKYESLINEDRTMFSSDSLVNAKIAESIKIEDLKANSTEKIAIKVLDKKELSNNDGLLGNLVYEIQPNNYFANDTLELSFFAEELGFDDTSGFKIAWWSYSAQEWGLLDTSIDNGVLKARTKYLTYYGIMKQIVEPVIEEEDEAPASTFIYPVEPPSISFQVYDGDVSSIFNSIRQEMGGTYGLSLNPSCSDPPFISTGAICKTGYSPQCGLTAVHCKPGRLGSENLNVLFRHEIVHNLQQLNGGCGESVRTEWGAEYISGSSYYTFKVNGQPASASQITSIMSSRGCTEQELRDAAVCKPDSYQILASKGCLPNNNQLATW